jgi:hypothetical protein
MVGAMLYNGGLCRTALFGEKRFETTFAKD